ncbi:MAG TPA: hypothetical protein VLH09_05105 [Bryobacteraceae bacterium]|nr:hypothetical protein [Bryobacteraceae bacterium]
MSEALLGHPDHGWLAVGQLSEAEDEIVVLYPAVAEAIREHRKRYEESLETDAVYVVPTLEMLAAITRFNAGQLNPEGLTHGHDAHAERAGFSGRPADLGAHPGQDGPVGDHPDR